MTDSTNSSNGSECSVFDTYPYVIVAAVSAGSAMVSALCCIIVICLVFLLKKHYFFIQRLILYHCLATLFLSFATVLRLHRLGYRNNSEAINALCIFSGFAKQLTNWFLIMDYSVITFTLLMTAIFHKNVARLECLYVVLIFIFPFTFNWIPFIENTYGLTGAWCWIRSINYEDCTTHRFGVILQTALLDVPEVIFVVVMIPTYVIVIIVVARQRCRWRRGREPHDQNEKALRQRINEEVWPLLFYPFGVLLLNIFPSANHIYRLVHNDDPSYVLWMLHAVFSPLQGGYVALVYTLDRDTLRRLTYRNFKAAMYSTRDVVQEYHIEAGELSDSFIGTTGHKTGYKMFKDGDKGSLLENQKDF